MALLAIQSSRCFFVQNPWKSSVLGSVCTLRGCVLRRRWISLSIVENQWVVLMAGMGAAYGTAKSGVGIASMGVMRPELVMKSIVPVVMAGVLGIYGLIIAVIISTGSTLL